MRFMDWRLWLGGLLLLGFLTMAIAPEALTAYDPLKTSFSNAMKSPSGAHWFGTDELGRDLYTRVVFGARVSFLVAASALGFSALVGTAIGLLSGYHRGWVDELSMRVLDVLMAFPGVLLAIAIAAGLGPGTFNIVLAMGIYSVPTFARLVRGATLSLREQDFVTAARAIGASDLRVLVRHVLPNIFATTVLVQIVVRFGIVILSAAGLGFLGLGVQPPQPEWGQLISAGRNYLGAAPHMMLAPGLVLVLAVLAFNLVGDWLQEATDPRMRDS